MGLNAARTSFLTRLGGSRRRFIAFSHFSALFCYKNTLLQHLYYMERVGLCQAVFCASQAVTAFAMRANTGAALS